MTYTQALRYLDSFTNYEKKGEYDYRKSFGLERITRLSALLGDPQKGIRSVHVAGTKGKGSTAAIIFSILRSSGYRTGLYTSPHLASFRERIRIGDDLISESEIGRLTDTVKGAVDRMPGEPLSFFELYTALAYLYFEEKAVDIAVYETGMGGRLDATNIITPLVSVITPISYEHTDKLGRSLSRIAFEKGGIIKKGVACVSSPQPPEAEAEIRKICRERGSGLVLVGRDVHYRELRADDEKEVFDVAGRCGCYNELEMKLLGSHQVVNAAVAIAAIEALRGHGIVISSDALRKGVADARWEGRLEVAGRKPYVILDGAQNRASANAVSAAVRKIFKYRRLHLVLGACRDKDIDGILEELLPISEDIVLTKADIPDRALEPEIMKRLIGGEKKVVLTTNVKEAMESALALADPDDLILVTGSLFVVGEARALLI